MSRISKRNGDHMSCAVLAFLAVLGLAFTGCEAGDTWEPDALTDPGASDLASEATTDVVAFEDPGTSDIMDAADVVPMLLQCVTARLADTHLPVVVRLAIRAAGQGYALRSERGFQHVITGPMEVEPDPQDWTADGTSSDAAWDLSWEGGGLHVARGDAGPVLAGTFRLGDPVDHEIACWVPGAQPPYRYDAERGRCVDGDGTDALGGVPLAFVSETGLGQCAVLSNVPLQDEDLYYPQLADWDLRGADLSGASLHFADLIDARLEGADLTNLDYGYANVTGTVDGFTTLPPLSPAGGCTLDGARLTCRK